ncbi:MAG: heavy metal translocating P-type ATPase [Culicoidibacterales bacterium]
MLEFIIKNMSCQNCKAKIEKLLAEKSLQGSVDVETKILRLQDSSNLLPEEMINLLAEAGYTAEYITALNTAPIQVQEEVTLSHPQFKVPDITCTNCALTVTKQLEKSGVVARINAGTKQMQITENKQSLSDAEIMNEVQKAGYTAVPIKQENIPHDHDHHGHEGHDHGEMFAKTGVWYKRGEFKLLWSIIAFILAEVPMMAHTFFHVEFPGLNILMSPWFQFILATLTMWLVGVAFFKGAWRALKNKVTTMDTLVTVGAFTAYGFSIMQMFVYQFDPMQHYFFEATIAIVALIYLGHYLEEKATSKTNTALLELTQLHADVAHVLSDGKVVTKKPSEVRIGETVVVYLGEKVPLDGIVTAGQGSINEAMVTGESLPIFKEEGQKVIGGTLLESGELHIRVLKDEAQGTLSSIIEAVEKAQFEKPAIQKTADKISSIFVPTILTLAILTFIIYFGFLQRDFWSSISTALSVVVISCPCAFGLATPLSILIGSSLAAKRGILYKSGATFEQVRHIDAVCFDKTGTLTAGTPNVVATFTDLSTHAPVLYQAEKQSEHPLALAIVRYIEENQLSMAELPTFQFHEESGKGVFAQNENDTYAIGSLKLIKQLNAAITSDQQSFIDTHIQKGASIVVIIENEKLLNILAIRDTVKQEARALIEKLHARGIKTYMITGDMKKPADAIASEIGIPSTHVFAEVRPVDKLEHIKQIQATGEMVAFVGDGINDAPALAQANLGIAVGTGAKVALSAADITLVGGNILLIDEALQISKATLRNIFTNFGWALSYNIVAIPVAMLGFLSPTLAATFMAFSDVVVVLNAATLKMFRKK